MERIVEQGEERATGSSSRARARSTIPPIQSVTLGLIHGATPHAMVLVHKPGLADHDFDHLPDRRRSPSRRCRPSSTSTSMSRDSSPRRRSSPSPSTPRSSATMPMPGGRSRPSLPRRACRPTTPCGSGRTGCGRRIEQGVDALPWVTSDDHGRGRRWAMTLELAERTLVLRLADPLLIARSSHGRGRPSTTVVIESGRRGRPDGPIGLGEGYPDRFYGETPATMSAVLPGCSRPRADRGRPSRRSRDGPRGARGGRRADERRHRPPRRGEMRARHRAPRPGRQALGLPVRELLGLPARDPAYRLLAGHRRARGGRGAGRPGRALPGAKIKVGGPADIETLEAVRAVYGGPLRVDANTGWSPSRPRRSSRSWHGWASSSSSSRSPRVRWRSCAGCGNAAACPSSPTSPRCSRRTCRCSRVSSTASS